MSRQASKGILACIKDHDNLRKLSLSKINLPPVCIPDLCTYLGNSIKLIYLDLSYNGLMSNQMSDICKVLGESNRRLSYLNLAWNTIVNNV
jgi:hypothetical protein